MASGKAWTREELLLAFNLYFRIPFGRQHARAPEIIRLAKVLARSPGSVAMKLNNITSLDPEERERGVHGLPGASQMDRAIWTEFQDNWEALSAESEALWSVRVQAIEEIGEDAHPSTPTPTEKCAELWSASSPTEKVQPAKVRLAQAFFRKIVLSAYNGQCCVTGIPVAQLLIASHILPWSTHPEHRADPRNGLCLSRLHDAAFDQGLMTLDEKNRLVLSSEIKEQMTLAAMKDNFAIYEGKEVVLPERFTPRPEYLQKHRESIFIP